MASLRQRTREMVARPGRLVLLALMLALCAGCGDLPTAPRVTIEPAATLGPDTAPVVGSQSSSASERPPDRKKKKAGW